MTTPNVPLRMERTFEVPGTPEQVWDAIATAERHHRVVRSYGPRGARGRRGHVPHG